MFSEKTTVFIGDLPDSIDSSWIREFVQEVAEPIGIRIFPDKFHRPILNALVNFKSEQDAQLVISELNYSKLNGDPIRLCLYHRRLNRSALLFVKGLDPSINVIQLHQVFATFGEVVSCKIPTKDGVSNGYGYVQFLHVEDANRALTDLQGANIEGNTIMISKYERKPPQNPDKTFTNVFIKNLPETVDSNEKLEKLFAEYGLVTSPFLAVPAGFGFCNMSTHEEAVKAIEGLNGSKVGDKELFACRQKSLEERKREIAITTAKWRRDIYEKTRGRNVYVRGFDEKVTIDDLTEVFSQFGEIESAKISTDREGTSKKFGFVLFCNNEDAQRAVFQSGLVKLHEKPLYIAFFRPKGAAIRIPIGPGKSGTVALPTSQKDKLKFAVLEFCGYKRIDDPTKYLERIMSLDEERSQALNENQEEFLNWFSTFE